MALGGVFRGDDDGGIDWVRGGDLDFQCRLRKKPTKEDERPVRKTYEEEETYWGAARMRGGLLACSQSACSRYFQLVLQQLLLAFHSALGFVALGPSEPIKSDHWDAAVAAFSAPLKSAGLRPSFSETFSLLDKTRFPFSDPSSMGPRLRVIEGAQVGAEVGGEKLGGEEGMGGMAEVMDTVMGIMDVIGGGAVAVVAVGRDMGMESLVGFGVDIDKPGGVATG
mmetsp:Transcript_18983/g.40868  ORF Transcript_18983/g.40868 Transcript_18983/m.40868 type:complete len:224 (+) Transcript_18983:189-860(+)